jgi:hypothetical protein
VIALESARALSATIDFAEDSKSPFAAQQPKGSSLKGIQAKLFNAGITLWKEASRSMAPALFGPVKQRLDAFVADYKPVDSAEAQATAALDEKLADSANWAFALAKIFRTTPASGINLQEAWWEVRDQERTSSCVGWALADLLWLQTNGAVDVPSARYIWTGAKELDADDRPTTFIAGAGVSLRAGLDLVRNVGCALESEIPSNSSDLFRGSIEDFYGRVGKRRIAGVMDLRGDFNLWLAWLATRRPIVCAILANREFATYRGGSNSFQSFDRKEPGMFRHAVVLAGWRMAPSACHQGSLPEVLEPESTGPTLPYPIEYLVRNCAGSDWGDQGYAYIPHHVFAKMCAETYGVLMTHAEVKNPGPRAVRCWWDGTEEVGGPQPAKAAASEHQAHNESKLQQALAPDVC